MRKALVAAVCVATTGCANSALSIASTTQLSAMSSGQSSANSSVGQSSTVESSDQSSATTALNLPSSIIVGASALVLGAVGGIITTVYQNNANAKAKLDAEEFRKLNPPQVPTLPAAPPPPEQLPPPSPEPTAPPTVPAPTTDAMVMARAWLVANQLQLKQDLALGAGPALDDLAGIAQIPEAHRQHFARVLQRSRGAFTYDGSLTPVRAAQLLGRVGQLVMADPVLAIDGARAAR